MPRLLLIEDEIGAIAALKRMLARAGHEVLVATNLPDALSAIEHEQPDALLVAAGLQGESAASLVEAIRGIDGTRPLIVMGDGRECGEPFLAKPVEPARLIALLHELVPGAPAPALEAPVQTLPPLRAAPPEAAPVARAEPEPEPRPPPAMPPATSGPPAPDLARRRELVAKTLAEAQARRQAARAGLPKAVEPLPPPKSPPQPPAQSTPQLKDDLNLPFFRTARDRLSAVEGTAATEPRETNPPPYPSPQAGEGFRPTAGLPLRERRINPSPEVLPPPTQAAQAMPLAPAIPLAKAVPLAEPTPREPEKPPARLTAPVEKLEVARSGTLDSIEPALLLLACHRSRLSGQLKLEQGLVQRVLYFDDGRLSGAASSSPDERLEALSYRRGLISREQQRLLRAEAQIPTRRLALLMVERAYLKPAELFPLVQERVEEVIYEACGTFAGKYQILSESVPDDERVALSRSPLALVTEGIRRKYLMDRLLSGLGGPATLLRPVRGPELADYGLTARERRLAQSVDGLRNIEELLFESGNEPLPGLKILYALLLGGSVEVAMRGLRSEASSEVEAKIDLTRVAEKYEQVRSANYFEVLGVSFSATAYEIEQSYDRLAREFQPGRFGGLPHPELPGQLDEIQRLLAEARDILVDEGLREEYRAHLRR